MKKVWSFIEAVGSILGFALLLGPPAFQDINRGVTIALLVTLAIAGGFGAFLMAAIVKSQREPSYFEKSSETPGMGDAGISSPHISPFSRSARYR